MSKLLSMMLLVVAMFTTGVMNGPAPAPAPAPVSEAELKERFRDRYQALEELKDAGKLGETTEGLVEVVRPDARGDTVSLPEGPVTVEAFVRAENADRGRLYALIGKRTNEPVGEVAQQAAIRNFARAEPTHFLKLRNGQWVQRKDLPEPQ